MYLVIAGDQYYPKAYGGDILKSFHTIEEANNWVTMNLVHDRYDWWCIMNAYSLKIVSSGSPSLETPVGV